MTKESYRHFVEHAYNQFFQHESFHSSACSKTTAKDLSAGGLSTSTKLKAYTWVNNDGRVARIPKTYASTYQMPDRPLQVDDDEDMDVDGDTDKQDLSLKVVIEPDAAEILGIPPEEVQRAWRKKQIMEALHRERNQW